MKRLQDKIRKSNKLISTRKLRRNLRVQKDFLKLMKEMNKSRVRKFLIKSNRMMISDTLKENLRNKITGEQKCKN